MLFEYDVILDSLKTQLQPWKKEVLFEYDVILDSSKTLNCWELLKVAFEYDVIFDSSKTSKLNIVDIFEKPCY